MQPLGGGGGNTPVPRPLAYAAVDQVVSFVR